MSDYKTPFQVKESVIYDAEGRKVKLWGVNYYTPFNSNFYNIEELGKDHFAAIDEDIRHFKLMNIDFIRMHLYDREITDREGNIVENKNMRVFDYLLTQCEKNGIYLMLTPTVWWNTVSNQIVQEKYYAYWSIDSQEAFGFSNYFSCDSMLWDPDAIRCQETYLHALFTRRSTTDGKRLNEYKNIVAFELFNEPLFPSYQQLNEDADPERQGMAAMTLSRGRRRLKLVAMWEAFRREHPEVSDDEQGFGVFRSAVVKNYFERLWPVVDHYFGRNVIKVQFPSYDGTIPEDLRSMFSRCDIDALALGTYLNVDQFDGANTDAFNHLELAKKWFRPYETLPKGKFARVAYEFDASATQNGYPLAAIAAMYAKYDVQMAAYFTYTPAAVAAWNPGWVVHFMNIAHTPSRAAGFAAGEIFRNHEPADPVEMEPEAWHGSDYTLERKNDFVCFKNETTFRYSNDNMVPPGDVAKLRFVSGRGKSLFAESSSNGCYFLERRSRTEWSLVIFPAQRFLREPGRGKTYRFMANRYVNCLSEPPVSQLFEKKVDFRLNALKLVACREAEHGIAVPPEADGSLLLEPGSYLLETEEP